MRTFVIPALILLLLVGGCIFERVSLARDVDRCTQVLDVLLEKTEQSTAQPEDVENFSLLWDRCKRRLHTYIPHTEIRDVDPWISESVSYLEQGEYTHAHAKLTLLRDKLAALPDSFRLSPENIF